jgi:acyl phosphate:glycerol-3-phosphate acyltransferase
MDAQSSMTYLVVGGLWPWLIYALVTGYVLGALPLGRMIRSSAGIAEGEAFSSLTNPSGLVAFLADAAKGMIAVLIAGHLYGTAPAFLAALGVVLGAAFPIITFFKRGEPLAAFFGAALALAPEAGIVFAICWAALSIAGAGTVGAALAVVGPPVSVALASYTTSIAIDPALPLTLALMALIVLLSYARALWRLGRGRKSVTA